MHAEITKSRVGLAESYDERTRSQPDWYSKKASSYKSLFQWIGVATIVLGASVGVIPLLSGGSSPSMADKVVAIFGALIVILKGVERIWLPQETWTNYRKASEALLREREKYIEGVGPYIIDDNEDGAYRLYVERCILIKAEEQNNFWGINSDRGQQEIDAKNKGASQRQGEEDKRDTSN